MKRFYRSTGAIAFGWLIGSCGGGDSIVGPPPPPTTASVTLSADAGTVVPAAKLQLTATARSAAGETLSRNFVWNTSDAAKVTVSSSGMVAGVAPGTATITAAVDGKSASATITVLDGGVVSTDGATLLAQSGAVQIVVPADAVATQTSLTVVASASSATDPKVVEGTAFEFGPSPLEFKKPVLLKIKYDAAKLPTGTEQRALKLHLSTSSGWQALPSVVDSVAKIVTAEVSHFSTYAVIIPTGVSAIAIRGPPDNPVADGASSLQVGGSEQLTATLTDSNGQILTDRTVTWASTHTEVATVVAGGLVTAVAPGSSNISASAGGVTVSIALTVVPIPVASVEVTIPTLSLIAGATAQATAITRAANGDVLSGRLVTWTSSNASVATVASDGVVSAVAAGVAEITATSEGKNGTASVRVTATNVDPIPVASVTVSLAPTSITAAGTSQATATTLDASGNTLTGRQVAWSSDNAPVAIVSAQGLVTGIAAGTASITAASEGKSGNATIMVTSAPVATVVVSLAASSINAVQTTQATAALLDAQGHVLTGRTVEWSSDNTAVATVSSTGLVTAVSVGTTNIAATSEGQAGSAGLAVNPAPVATVTVNPATASLVLGIAQTQQLTVVTKDSNGNVLGGRSVTWGSSNTGVAAVDTNGLVTAVGAGTSTITASSEGQSGTCSITVTVAPVASVTVSAPTTPMVVGGTQQLTAVTKDANGNVLTARTVSWVSSNTAVLTVSANGSPATVTAAGVGSATIAATSETVNSSPTPPITVNPAPVVSVTLSSPTTPMLVGSTQVLTAVPRDGSNNTLAGRTVSWASSNTAVLTVSVASSVSTSGGAIVTVTAVGPGTATITATSESAPAAMTPLIAVSPRTVAGPLRKSTVNPRYFADQTGRVVYLTGSEYWNTIEDNGVTSPPPVFDYSAFLDFLQAHNHNFTRLFMWEQARWSSLTPVDHYFAPNLYVRTGPGTAIDGGPKFDLTQLNPAYLARVRQRVIDAGARGIYVSVQLFNGWSVDIKSQSGNNPWLSHPFNAANNINGINGDPNNDQSGKEIQTLSIAPVVTALQETYVKAVIDAVNDLDNVIFEISNESEREGTAWQYHMIDLIRSYEATKPKQHPIGMTVPWPNGSNSDVTNSAADWMSLNGDINNVTVADGSKVSLNDTDHLCGICGDAGFPWRNFANGHNTLLMDGYNGAPGYTDPNFDPRDPKWEVIRTNMGYARSYALRMDLAHALPRGDLATSGFCLAVVGSEYLVFVPGGGSVVVNLSGVSGQRTVEWFNPATGQTLAGGTVNGGASPTLIAPFSGRAVVYIHP